MKNAGHIIFITTGIIFLIAAAGVFIYGAADDYMARRRAAFLLNQITVFNENTDDLIVPVTYEPIDNIITEDKPVPTSAPNILRQARVWFFYNLAEMLEPIPKGEAAILPGYETAGIIELPGIDIKLPVISTCTNALLKVSPCLYDGTIIKNEKPEKLIIAGHNYKSHFGKIRQMKTGDAVSFTGSDKKTYTYAVTEIKEISMYAHAALYKGEWDLIIFTCNSNNRANRIVAKCIFTE